MEIGAIIVALIVIAIAWKILAGMVKFAVIGVVILAALLFFSQGAIA